MKKELGSLKVLGHDRSLSIPSRCVWSRVWLGVARIAAFWTVRAFQWREAMYKSTFLPCVDVEPGSRPKLPGGLRSLQLGESRRADGDGLSAIGWRENREIEAADDFVASNPMTVNAATFTGLITGATPTIGEVVVEIYRVFPGLGGLSNSANAGELTFGRRVRPRDAAASSLTFTTATLAASFSASNSVLNGIHPIPTQTTQGEGAVSGKEVQFTVNFTTPFNLPANHYFFIPQVQVTGGQFYWLSAPRPVTGSFAFTPDLQTWIRNQALDPDWLRVGTDIVGGTTPPTFNASFSLNGVPEPSSVLLFALGAVGLAGRAADPSEQEHDGLSTRSSGWIRRTALNAVRR